MSPFEKKTLFWDTDTNNIDLSKHKRYIIERILKFGDLTDYSWLKGTYSVDDIKEILKRERSELDKKSLNFWSIFYDIS